MPQNLIQTSGGPAQKPTKFASIFTSRFFLGLFTNRSLLRGPLNTFYSDFYHIGTTDVLCDGLNSELSIQLTMIRRAGNPKFSSSSIASIPDTFYGFHRSDGNIQTIVDTVADVEVLTSSAATSIFTKTVASPTTAGAGEGYFQGVLNTLYIADGVDLVQYTPTGNTNPTTGKPIWNWGGPAPASAPTLTVLPSGVGLPSWTASVYFSTMGMIKATPTGGALSLYQLTSVNADPNNPNTTQIGLSGSGQPVWNNGALGSTTDGTVQWTCSATPVQLWQPNHTYGQLSIVFDPGTGGLYLASHSGTKTSGSAYPHFLNNGISVSTIDNTVKWRYMGKPSQIGLWQPSHSYSSAFNQADDSSFSLGSYAIEPVLPTTANVTSGIPAIYVQFVRQTGTSGTFSQPNFPGVGSSSVGSAVQDGQLQWTLMGLAAYPVAGTTLVPWTLGATQFSTFIDAAGNLEVCTTGGIAMASPPTMGVNYGDPSVKASSGEVWANCGSMTNGTWVSASKFYLPIAGFQPPSQSVKFGGAGIVDVNSPTQQQWAITSGFSGGGGAPGFSAVFNATTVDNNVTWENNGPISSNSMTWTSGFGYAFSWKSRTLQDIYSLGTTVPVSQRVSPNLIVPPGTFLPIPSGALTGDVTTASPIAILTGPNSTGGIVQVQGQGTLDPQYDTVEIYRTVDGGQSGTILEYLTDIPMPAPLGPGIPGVWTLLDYMPTLPTATLSGLNPLILAPVAHQNDPPPGQVGSIVNSSGLIGIQYHQGRLWGFVGSTVYASGGPDTNPGNGFDAWPPGNNFPFQSNVVRLLPHVQGLLVFTTTDVYVIAGGPTFSTYYSQLLIPGLGISSWNAVTIIKGVPYVFSSDRQLFSVDPSGGIIRVGHPIGDKLDKFNPTAVYLTYHSSGDSDHALFLADGSTGWYRCDPSLAPDGDTTGPVWSPFATVNGGNMKALASIETAPGVHTLLMGSATAGGFVLARDSSFSIFTDGGAVNTGVGGTSYDSYFTMGNIVLCSAGQMAMMDFIEMDFMNVGAQPTVSVLLDELSATNGATFETISNSFVSDPPKKFGLTGLPKTMWMNRYYFGQTTPQNNTGAPALLQTPAPAWCKFLQIKVDFGNDAVKNEALSMTIFGSLWQEK